MAEFSKDQQQVEASPNRAKRSWGGLLMALLVLFGLLAIGAIVFYLDLQHQGQQKGLSEKVTAELGKKDQQVMELTQQISGYQTQIAAIQGQLANVQQAANGKDSHYNQALDDFSKLYTEKLDITKQELKTSIDQVQRLLGKTRTDWMIADAEYLLNVANQRLLLMGDVGTAKQALEAADARLRESEDAAVFKVREQVVKELAELAKASELDLVGLYAKITALQQDANHLTVLLPYVGKQEKAESLKPQASDEAEGGLLGKALGGMKDIVSIKHSEVPIAGIISKEEALFDRQQIKVRLDMVKMALLQKNENLYVASINDVKQWLEENFNKNAAANDFLKQLNDIAAIKIQSHLPDITESLKMLKAITKTRAETDKILPKTATDVKMTATPSMQNKLQATAVEPSKSPVVSPSPIATPMPEAAKPMVTAVPETHSSPATTQAPVAPAPRAETAKP